MQIRFDSDFEKSLLLILDYIASDKVSAAIGFRKELQDTIALLSDNPYMFKQSHYFDEDVYRDLIYKGYTIIYKINKNEIVILEIFKWIER